VATILTLLATSATAAEPSHLRPVPSVLLLQNGQAIEGNISRAGDTYFVGLPGGEIRVHVASVELWCRNLEEGYQRKRAVVQLGNVHDHLDLAQWCIHHGLQAQAWSELSAAAAADPAHPMIGLLKRRLEAAVRPAEDSSQSAKPGAGPPADPPVSLDDLDRLIRGMPDGSVEAFTQSVQPLLINNCTAAGCHGPDSSSEFRLLRFPPGQTPSRRLTQRNLHATLQWIDREEPSASRLLSAATRPHGTAAAAVFNHHQVTQYQQLARWIEQLAERPKPAIPTTIDLRTGPPARPHEENETVVDSLGVEPATPAPDLEPGPPTLQFAPIDPFDPEIFNRLPRSSGVGAGGEGGDLLRESSPL